MPIKGKELQSWITMSLFQENVGSNNQEIFANILIEAHQDLISSLNAFPIIFFHNLSSFSFIKRGRQMKENRKCISEIRSSFMPGPALFLLIINVGHYKKEDCGQHDQEKMSLFRHERIPSP